MATKPRSKEKMKDEKADSKTKSKSSASAALNGQANQGRKQEESKGNTVRDHALRVDIGLEKDDMKAVSDLLNNVLANLTVLAVKTKNYHWNVSGIHFNDLHKFFEKQYDKLADEQDEVAERVRMLGMRPLGNMQEFIDHATLKEEERVDLDAISMLRSLLADQEELIKQLRDGVDKCQEEHDDEGNGDFLNNLMQEHEKDAWMIRMLCA